MAAYGDIRARVEHLVEHELPEAEELAHQVTGAVDVIMDVEVAATTAAGIT